MNRFRNDIAGYLTGIGPLKNKGANHSCHKASIMKYSPAIFNVRQSLAGF